MTLSSRSFSPSTNAKALIVPVLLITALTLTAFGCKPRTESNANTNAVDTGTVQNTQTSVNRTNATVTNTTQPTRSTTEQELRQLALSFAERYGSYSNQTNFANLENLLLFMTDAFASTTRSFIDEERGKNRDTTVYYGITTKAAAVATDAFRESQGTAVFTVQTLRREAIGSTSNVRHYQQAITMTMKKGDGAWKVDSAEWQ